MKRFCGMMPTEEIEKIEHLDIEGHNVTVEAGPHGWTVIWGDKSTNYKDVDVDTETNFNSAMKCVKKYYPNYKGDFYSEEDIKNYNACVNRLIERIERDIDHIYSIIKKFPTRESFCDFQNESDEPATYEDAQIVTSYGRHYEKFVYVMNKISKDEFIKTLKAKLLDLINEEDPYRSNYNNELRSAMAAERYYDYFLPEIAVKLAFNDNYGLPLRFITRGIRKIIDDYTESVKKIIDFNASVSFTIKLGSHEYQGWGRSHALNNTNTCDHVKNKLSKEVADFLDGEITSKIKEKYPNGITKANVYVSADLNSDRFVEEVLND